MDSPVDNPAWLQWMETLLGGVSTHSCASAFPPDRYYCLLDELPLHLIPGRTRSSAISDCASVVVDDAECWPLQLNPQCVLLDAAQVPDSLRFREELLHGFARRGTIAWVPDVRSGFPLPFWLGPRLESAIRGLKSRETVPKTFDAADCARLRAAGILQGFHTSPQSRDGVFLEAGRHFRERDYAPLGGLIHPFHVAALRRYCRYLIRMGKVPLGDGQSSRRYVAYNEPVAKFFHRFLTATLSAVAGEALKPSYVYLASYLSGSELKKHTDREQCEFSITLCLDFTPEPELETPWPIQLETPSGNVTVYQALGDGLAYRGTRLPHFREKLAEGQISTSIFFHYVAADYSGSLD
jgi:hypothetical protein